MVSGRLERLTLNGGVVVSRKVLITDWCQQYPSHSIGDLAIGPEGGWNDFELSLLASHGFQVVGLGPRTLRVDTACTALLAITHASIAE